MAQGELITVTGTKNTYSTAVVSKTIMPSVGDTLAQWDNYWRMSEDFDYSPYFGFNVYASNGIDTNSASADFPNINVDQNGNRINISEYRYSLFCGYTSSSRTIQGDLEFFKDLSPGTSKLILISGYDKAVSIGDDEDEFDPERGTIHVTLPDDVPLPCNFIFAMLAEESDFETFSISTDDKTTLNATAKFATPLNSLSVAAPAYYIDTITIQNQNIVTSGSPKCVAVMFNEYSNAYYVARLLAADNADLTNEIVRTDFNWKGAVTENLKAIIAVIVQETPTTTKLSYDLSTSSKWASLASGTHQVTIVAKGTGYQNSEPSAAVAVTKAVLISFTISGTSYQAEAGMTWGQWVNSEYNTVYHSGKWIVYNDGIAEADTGVFMGYVCTDSDYERQVEPTDVIRATEYYVGISGR